VVYFTQPVSFIETSTKETVVFQNTTDEQKEYYAKITGTITNKLSIIGAYHYFNTSYLQKAYNNNAGLAGLKFVGNYFDVQADVNFSRIDGNSYTQYNGKLTVYPLGNLNLYSITGYSYQQATTPQSITSELLGFKAFKNIWIEGSATIGKLNNYFEYDALYIYNAIDITTFKTGCTGYYQLNNHALLYLNYTYEQKDDTIDGFNYNQGSITGGVKWKF